MQPCWLTGSLFPPLLPAPSPLTTTQHPCHPPFIAVPRPSLPLLFPASSPQPSAAVARCLMLVLQSVEQRRREALGEQPHDPLHVLLLKHRTLGLWPASEQQRHHFQRVLGLEPLLEVRVGGWVGW